MGDIRKTHPMGLVVAAFSRHDAALDWAREQLTKTYGPIALCSPPFPFVQTRYYAASMGSDLRKQFWVFTRHIAADRLADVKLHTNELEKALIAAARFPESRPLNLDPGLLTLGKFMLATTKDQAHRIYLRDGIFAESTLRFHAGTFEPWPWTYADYREPHVIDFLNQAREWYRQSLDRG